MTSRPKLSYGDLEVTRALASVAAKTAYGSIQLHEVSSGSIEVESGFGEITVGVRPGVPAWLDLSSKNGHVRNELDGDRAPDRRPSRPSRCARAPRPATSPSSGPADRGPPTEGTIAMTTTAIDVHGLRKSYGDKVVLDGVDLERRGGHRHRPARPERRRQDDDRAHPLDAGAARRRHRHGRTAATSSATRTACAPSIGLTGQFSAVDKLLTGEENLLLMARLRHLGAKRSKTRVAELLEQFDLADARPQAARHLLRAGCGAGSTSR